MAGAPVILCSVTATQVTVMTVERPDSGVDGGLLGHDGSEETTAYLDRTGERG